MINATNKDTAFTDSKTSASNLNQDVHNVAHDLHDVAHNAGRKVRSMYNSASTEISDDISLVTSQIRKNPVQSSMIALGAGLLLGALLRRA